MPILDNYILDTKIIARGFSSVVYKGIDKKTNDEVAIKCIDESVLDDPSKKTMLANEMNIQWSFKDEPNIVQIKAQFYDKDSIFIVTEFCEFGDLKNKIKQKGKFVEAKAVSYMLDIIHGFKALVKNNIVHRDIKSANIFISKKGIKIGDFGFAYKTVQNTTKNHEDNVPNAGSPLYMAPQVLEDGKNTSHLSDIWSLGVVFFQMVTGRLPFPAKNKDGLMKLIEKIGIRTILPQNISLRSKQFLVRTLKKDPTKRITPEELITFEFDDEILFKIKQHRAKKKEEELKRQLDAKSEAQYPEMIEPETFKTKNEDESPPESIKKCNKAIDKFDNNLHQGKNFLDPKDIHAQKIKRKSNEKKHVQNDHHDFGKKDDHHEGENKDNHHDLNQKTIEQDVEIKKKKQNEMQVKVLSLNGKKEHYETKTHKNEKIRGAQIKNEAENPERQRIKRVESIISIDKKIEEQSKIEKQEIIETLLSQIDIIRFLSRIVHKMEQIHHLHVNEHKESHRGNGKQSLSKHLSSKDVYSVNVQNLKNYEQLPEVYVQMRLLMYRTLLEIQRLQFLPEDQAFKFFRSEEYDEIRLILDTYKSKLDLAVLKSFKWKGLHFLQNELEKQIIFIYNKIKLYIHHYESHSIKVEPQSKEMKKLNHKIQALNYLIVLRYDYLIMQRESVMIDEQNKKSAVIKAIIEDKHSKQHDGKKTFQESKHQFRHLGKKIKQVRLI